MSLLVFTYATILTFVAIFFVVSGLDDLFIDVVALVARLAPQRLSHHELATMMKRSQKRIAIVVPAWDEGELIEKMVLGNVNRIHYTNYTFFVGVYPNDQETIDAVARAERRTTHVRAVVNDNPGPTSKGQMLNVVVRELRRLKNSGEDYYDALLMQDSEDVIHPYMLALVNEKLDEFDYIQTPVFSFPISAKHPVGGTYMDEFAESHTKDLLVRAHLGAPIPSAGVGTALSFPLVEKICDSNGEVFNGASLTEDYELGINAGLSGVRSTFACCYVGESRDYISTREYFPKSVWRSIKQKTRWTVGIVFQGTRHLGWRGNVVNKYFLMRDRKGIITNPLALLGYALVALSFFVESSTVEELYAPLGALLAANLTFMFFRLSNRCLSIKRVYGMQAIPLSILRWPVAILINVIAVFRATFEVMRSRFGKTQIAWSKTQHELPDFFVSEERSTSEPVYLNKNQSGVHTT